jgi:hypothetical protein
MKMPSYADSHLNIWATGLRPKTWLRYRARRKSDLVGTPVDKTLAASRYKAAVSDKRSSVRLEVLLEVHKQFTEGPLKLFAAWLKVEIDLLLVPEDPVGIVQTSSPNGRVFAETLKKWTNV